MADVLTYYSSLESFLKEVQHLSDMLEELVTLQQQLKDRIDDVLENNGNPTSDITAINLRKLIHELLEDITTSVTLIDAYRQNLDDMADIVADMDQQTRDAVNVVRSEGEHVQESGRIADDLAQPDEDSTSIVSQGRYEGSIIIMLHAQTDEGQYFDVHLPNSWLCFSSTVDYYDIASAFFLRNPGYSWVGTLVLGDSDETVERHDYCNDWREGVLNPPYERFFRSTMEQGIDHYERLVGQTTEYVISGILERRDEVRTNPGTGGNWFPPWVIGGGPIPPRYPRGHRPGVMVPKTGGSPGLLGMLMMPEGFLGIKLHKKEEDE